MPILGQHTRKLSSSGCGDTIESDRRPIFEFIYKIAQSLAASRFIELSAAGSFSFAVQKVSRANIGGLGHGA
jgi:hypothetical protein